MHLCYGHKHIYLRAEDKLLLLIIYNCMLEHGDCICVSTE